MGVDNLCAIQYEMQPKTKSKTIPQSLSSI